jgi:hypothetical protein
VSVSFNGSYGVSSYGGVGFQENQVADLYASVNGQADTNLTDFHAQINWGDNSSWTPGDLVYVGTRSSAAEFYIKGSHIYNQPSGYPIVVYVTGPDGTSTSWQTASARVYAMPSGLPGEQPSQTGTLKAPADVSVSFNGSYGVSSYAGVGFQENQVADLFASVNGQADTNPTDFHAQINWGDNSSWTPGDLVYVDTRSSAAEFYIKGSHIYTQPSGYPIVVYVTGPDGTSTSWQTASADVQPNPNPPGPPLTGKGTITAEEGHDLSGPLATFQDSGSTTGLSATIEADGFNPEAGTIVPEGGDTFAIDTDPQNPIVFNQPGPVDILIILADARGDTSMVIDQVNVIAPPQTSGTQLNLTEGQDSGQVVVAHITPAPGGSAPTGATITWGDSSPPTPGTIVSDGQGGYNILGDHTYADHSTYNITVTIADPDGTIPQVLSTANVADIALTGQGENLQGYVGVAHNNVPLAVFRDPGQPDGGASEFDQYQAAVYWSTNPNQAVPDHLAVSSNELVVEGNVPTNLGAGKHPFIVHIWEVGQGGAGGTFPGSETLSTGSSLAAPLKAELTRLHEPSFWDWFIQPASAETLKGQVEADNTVREELPDGGVEITTPDGSIEGTFKNDGSGTETMPNHSGTVTVPGEIQVNIAKGEIPQEAGVDWNGWYFKWMDVVGENVFQRLNSYFAQQPGSVPKNEYTATVTYNVYPDGRVEITGGTTNCMSPDGRPLKSLGQAWGNTAGNYLFSLNAGYDRHKLSLVPPWPKGSKLPFLPRTFTFSRNWPNRPPGVFYAGPPQE